jgi:hypothetical protein
MQRQRLNGPDGVDLEQWEHTVTLRDRKRLGIKVVTRINGQMTAGQQALEPAQLTCHAYDRSTGVEAILVFTSSGSERHLRSVQSLTNRRRQRLISSDLNLPLRKIKKELRILISDLEHQGSDVSQLGPAALATERHRGGRRVANTPERLLEIARLYNAHGGAPGSTEAIADETSLSTSTISDLILAARKAGFLEPTTPGKKNWNLTRKAKRAIKQFDQEQEAHDGDGG